MLIPDDFANRWKTGREGVMDARSAKIDVPDRRGRGFETFVPLTPSLRGGGTARPPSVPAMASRRRRPRGTWRGPRPRATAAATTTP